jgi:predicted RNA-binding protein YlxR (DUF448 family)
MKRSADKSRTEKPRMKGPGPVRTCVGCRERDAQADLLRVVARDGRVQPDPRRRLSGRGAYVHVPTTGAQRQCLERALRRGGLARALRVGVRDEDAVAVCEAAARAAERAGEEPRKGKGQ